MNEHALNIVRYFDQYDKKKAYDLTCKELDAYYYARRVKANEAKNQALLDMDARDREVMNYLKSQFA